MDKSGFNDKKFTPQDDFYSQQQSASPADNYPQSKSSKPASKQGFSFDGFRTSAMSFGSSMRDRASEGITNIQKYGPEYARSFAKDAQDLGGHVGKQGYSFFESSRQQVNQGTKSFQDSFFKNTGNTQTSQGLEQQVHEEAKSKPVPRPILSSCIALQNDKALSTPKLFIDDAPLELVEHLHIKFMQAKGACLFPPATEPTTIAQFLKFYLSMLPEPLLTYRMVPMFVSSVHDFGSVEGNLQQLPLANRISLKLILDLLNRIASNHSVNQVSSAKLAAALVPSLAWHPLPPQNEAHNFQGESAALGPNVASPNELRGLPLEPNDQRALEIVLEHLITTYNENMIKV